MRVPSSISFRTILAIAAITVVVCGDVPAAHARDFFSSFFEILSGRPPSPPQQRALGYNDSGDPQFQPQHPGTPAVSGGRSAAFCVRTCDGRYFPIAANSEQSRAATCSSLCPASDTKVFYGSSIERATSDGGKPYSSLPNAFKYREQLVSGCTCNGKDSVGLASISIEDDKTLRKGDIVAGEDGLIVATRNVDRKRGAVANFSPAPRSIRAKFERAHALALQ